jgi:hypothetical protein
VAAFFAETEGFNSKSKGNSKFSQNCSGAKIKIYPNYSRNSNKLRQTERIFYKFIQQFNKFKLNHEFKLIYQI